MRRENPTLARAEAAALRINARIQALADVNDADNIIARALDVTPAEFRQRLERVDGLTTIDVVTIAQALDVPLTSLVVALDDAPEAPNGQPEIA